LCRKSPSGACPGNGGREGKTEIIIADIREKVCRKENDSEGRSSLTPAQNESRQFEKISYGRRSGILRKLANTRVWHHIGGGERALKNV